MNRLIVIMVLGLLPFLFGRCDIQNQQKAMLGYGSRVELAAGLDSLYSISNLLSHFPSSYSTGYKRSKDWWSEHTMPPSYIIEEDTIYSDLSASAYFVVLKTKEFIDSLVRHTSFSDVIPYCSDNVIHVKISNIKSSEPYARKYNRVGLRVDTSRAPIPDFEFANFRLSEVTDDTLGYLDYNDTLLMMGDRFVLPNDLIVYVLESQSGDFWKVKNTETRPVVLSDRWRHGCSRGYAISSSLNMVCYWMMAW